MAMVKQETSQALAPSQAPTPMMMLQAAVERGTDMDQLTKLMDLQERWEKNEARKAYVTAMAEFKSEPLEVTKGKHVRFETQKGVTEYDHATLAQVVAAVVATLSKHGLSHRWETSQANGLVTVACVITHKQGHSERTELSASPDQSGGKNSIQSIGSTVTYLQRYTLMAATGLAAKDMDDDGRTAAPDPINGTQHDTLMAKIEATNTDLKKFCAAYGIEELRDLPASRFNDAMTKLAAKAKRRD